MEFTPSVKSCRSGRVVVGYMHVGYMYVNKEKTQNSWL